MTINWPVAVCALIVAVIGAMHLVYTLFGTELHPREETALKTHRSATLRVSPAATMWRAWIWLQREPQPGPDPVRRDLRLSGLVAARGARTPRLVRGRRGVPGHNRADCKAFLVQRAFHHHVRSLGALSGRNGDGARMTRRVG